MKKLLEIVFGVLLLFANIVCFSSCKSNAISGEWVPNGDVCSYTDTIYQAKESFGDVSKGTLLSIEKHFLNENNMDTLLVLYTPDGKEEKRTTYYYDSDRQVVKKIEYSYHENYDDLFGKSINEVTNTTIYDNIKNGNKMQESKAITYGKMYFEGIDTDSVYLDGFNDYVKRTNYDTLRSKIIYKYENSKVIENPMDEDTEIYYIGSDGKNLIQVNFRGKTIQKYNERGLLIERMFEFNEESYGSERILIEYVYDSMDNPIVIKSFRQVNNKRMPDAICFRHYDYK